MAKRFKLSREQIRPLIPAMGGCIATDGVTVEGKPVAFMNRGAPVNPQDSGWFITAGESAEYLNDRSHLDVYDLNTIANCDPRIVRFLTYPVGTEVVLDASGQLVAVGDPPAPPAVLLPGVTPGPVQLTPFWQAQLGESLFRRVEDYQLVLWKPQLTFWISAFEDQPRSAAANLEHFTSSASPQAFDLERSEQGGVHRLIYRIDEAREDGQVQPSAQAVVCFESRVLIAAAYFDDEPSRALALAFLRSLTPSG
ncbi:MAG: DUF2185 domain-containing protein [Polyangiaceae bacterium]